MSEHESPTEPPPSSLEERLAAEVAAGHTTVATEEVAEVKRTSRAKGVALGIGLVAALILAVLGHRALAPVQVAATADQASARSTPVPVDALVETPGGGWMATMPSGWKGAARPAVAQEDCLALLTGLAPDPAAGTRLVLFDATGNPVSQCSLGGARAAPDVSDDPELAEVLASIDAAEARFRTQREATEDEELAAAEQALDEVEAALDQGAAPAAPPAVQP